jgi:predicted HTH domain antitoxin
MDQIKIDLPFHVSPKEARLLLCFKLLEADRISLGKAAELGGYSKRAFMELLAKQGISVINYASEELDRELEI